MSHLKLWMFVMVAMVVDAVKFKRTGCDGMHGDWCGPGLGGFQSCSGANNFFNCTKPQANRTYGVANFKQCLRYCPPWDSLDYACALHDLCTFIYPSFYTGSWGKPKEACVCNCLLVRMAVKHWDKPQHDILDCISTVFQYQDCFVMQGTNQTMVSIGPDGAPEHSIAEFCTAEAMEEVWNLTSALLFSQE